MDENSALIEQILREDEIERNGGSTTKHHNDGGDWQTVSYNKRNKKPSRLDNSAADHRPNGSATTSDVFRSIELHSEDRRRRAIEAKLAAGEDSGAVRSNRNSEKDGEYTDEAASAGEGGAAEASSREAKPKKPKKPKVTVAEAAAKIDAGYLGAFLVDITASYESQQDIQLMRFADFFGRAFASVTSSQFPWLKLFKESSVAKMVDIPLSHISEDVYKISADWLNKRSLDAIGSFMLWSLDNILADFASHRGPAKGTKKAAQQVPSKSQVAIFVVLAMAFRCKPDVLISLLTIISENPKYQGQDKLPITVWMIAQASQGDLAVGLYLWIHVLLPMLSGKTSNNPQARDLNLQLVERILSSPKARPILINGAVRKGERLVPPSALKLLLSLTFPAPLAQLKATDRFAAVYPTLKEVALAGSPGSKAMKQVSQQMLDIAVKAAGEGVPDLSREASDIFIWCLTQNPECYKQWDIFYLDNLEASVLVLQKMSNEWNVHSVKHLTLDPVREALKSLRQKNEKELMKAEGTARHALLKDADKYCKVILGRLSGGHGCMKSVVLLSVALAVGAAFMSKNLGSGDLQKLSAMFRSQ